MALLALAAGDGFDICQLETSESVYFELSSRATPNDERRERPHHPKADGWNENTESNPVRSQPIRVSGFVQPRPSNALD
jgi:hypothetical protein